MRINQDQQKATARAFSGVATSSRRLIPQRHNHTLIDLRHHPKRRRTPPQLHPRLMWHLHNLPTRRLTAEAVQPRPAHLVQLKRLPAQPAHGHTQSLKSQVETLRTRSGSSEGEARDLAGRRLAPTRKTGHGLAWISERVRPAAGHLVLASDGSAVLAAPVRHIDTASRW